MIVGDEQPIEMLAAAVAEMARAGGHRIAVAESLTGGLVASALAKAEGASSWFRGSVVAYASAVKHEVLGVPPGPVVSSDAAAAMAEGVRRLLSAHLAVSVTGVGGPREQDGQPPGTVFLAVTDGESTRVARHHFPGDPGEVCARSTEATLTLLVDALEAVQEAVRDECR
jgi:nicotinamide-nucleotide amidase